MKVLYFLINMNLGGTEKSFLNLLEELPADTEVDLLLLEDKGSLMNSIPNTVNVSVIENSGIINNYIALGSRRFGLMQLAAGDLFLFLRCMLQFLLQKMNLLKNPYWAIGAYVKPLPAQYDISVAYAGVHNFIAHYILRKTHSTKKVLWVHFDISKVISNTDFGTKYYPQFNQIFCVAENAGSVFKERFPATSGKVFTFNNIINTKTLTQQAATGETFDDAFDGIRILTLGRLSKEKGQQMIPEIVARLKTENHDFRWYLIGEGALLPELEEKIRTLGLDEHLVLLGRKMNPYGYLRDCALYVQTSFYEGDPVVLREAKAFQRPLVTTNFLSASNLITNNVDGLIVEISEDGLFWGIKTMLDNKELRECFANVPPLDLNSNIEIDSLLNWSFE